MRRMIYYSSARVSGGLMGGRGTHPGHLPNIDDKEFNRVVRHYSITYRAGDA